MGTKRSYDGILVDLYDQLFDVSDEECAFFRYFLIKVPGPALEVACGTGQFLMLFAQEGFDVTGLDSSQAMLDRCQKKLQASSLEVSLFCQSMQDMSIPRAFKTISIPSCSFMHLTDLQDARRALQRFYEHLAPGGQLLISLFSKNNEENAQLALLGEYALGQQTVRCSREFVYHPTKQIQTAYYRFDTMRDDVLVSSEVHELTWRLYGMDEFFMMLSHVGFKQISIHSDYTLMPPDEASQILIFRAVKL
jgi:ubiquinone/menaquinone biosynthesis C-methylase UbiE